MTNWWRRLLRLRPNGPEPAAQQAKQVQEKQFEEWGTVMREVDRVQNLAKGRPHGARH